MAGVLLVGFVGGFAAGGYFYKDQINSFLSQFSTFIEGSFSDFSTFLRFYFNSSRLLLIWFRNSSLFGSYFVENSVSLEFLMRIYGRHRQLIGSKFNNLPMILNTIGRHFGRVGDCCKIFYLFMD